MAASTACHAGGSPWLDRLGVDPDWLFATARRTTRLESPEPGLQARSASLLAFRSPLRLEWSDVSIRQTLLARSDTGTAARFEGWVSTGVADVARDVASRNLSTRAPGGDMSAEAGWLGRTGPFALRSRVSTGTGGRSGAVAAGLSLPLLELAAEAATSDRRADIAIATSQGTLRLDWSDRTDSIGAVVSGGPDVFRLTAGLEAARSRSPDSPGLRDTGSASGWRLGVGTRIGDLDASILFSRRSSELRTLGRRDGRVFHDQSWSGERASLEFDAHLRAWTFSVGVRQLRVELPGGGLDRPFVHWNAIPDDEFTRVASVLEDRAEHLDGGFDVSRTWIRLGRAWTRGGLRVSCAAGGSVSGFEAAISRTTVKVEGLFPSTRDDVPVDGAGWIAMAEVSGGASWDLPRPLGSLRVDGFWHQPLAGAWRDATRASNASGTRRATATANPVDPVGFHGLAAGWSLAF